ncbi:MAG: hypothetical protein Q9160_004756 [Pyrenula sp. 1 TL-2023]
MKKADEELCAASNRFEGLTLKKFDDDGDACESVEHLVPLLQAGIDIYQPKRSKSEQSPVTAAGQVYQSNDFLLQEDSLTLTFRRAKNGKKEPRPMNKNKNKDDTYF